jgi:hypothetical protein
MQNPYIGITDFETVEQVEQMLAVFEKAQQQFPDPILRKFMIGIMMSYKTQNDLPTKWSSVWISKEKISSLMIDHPLAYNCVHYADYTKETRAENLLRAAESGGSNMHALQLDMIWPSVEMIAEFKKEYPQTEVILQIGKPSFGQINDNPVQFVKKLEEYGNLLDFVLLDKSMGRGVGLNALELLPFIEAIVASQLDIGITVAGGLGPKTLHLLKPLAEYFPFLSIDAQGQLKPDANPEAFNDWSLASDYLTEAIRMFAENNQEVTVL